MYRNDHPYFRLLRKRTLILQISFIIALGLVLMAFSWHIPYTTSSMSHNSGDDNTIYVSNEVIVVPRPNIPEEKLVEEKPKTIVSNEIREIDDPEKVVEEFKEPDISEEVKKIPEEKGDIIDVKKPLRIAEKMPQFPGGNEAMYRFLQKNLKYPDCGGIKQEGMVYLQFVIGADGEISEMTLLRGICESVDKEVMRVVKRMPTWTPGSQNGKAVPVYFTLPVKFTVGN